MLALVRDGYGREIAALFILTVVIGAAIVGGAGAAVDRWLAEAVESLVGVPGEYDIIVHVQARAGKEAVRALSERLGEIAPGYRLKEGPTLVGRANLFVGLPRGRRNAESFERLEEELGGIPGFDGISVIVEPSVLVKDAHPYVAERLTADASHLPNVVFHFERDGNLWFVAESAGAAEGVRESLEAAAGRFGILDVRLPSPAGGEELARIASEVEREARGLYPDVGFRLLSQGASQTASDLAEVKRLLLEVIGQDRSELRKALEDAEAALESAAASGSVREDIAALLETFEQAVAQLEGFERRALELAERLKEPGASDGVANVLIAMLVERLFAGLQGVAAQGVAAQGDAAQGGPAQGAQGAEQAVDLEQLKSGIASLADRLVAIESVDFDTLIEGVRRLEASIASIDRQTEERILALIDRAIEAQGGDGARLEFLVEGDWSAVDAGALATAAASRLGQPGALKAYLRPAGIVEPDARTVLSGLLARAGDAVSLALALLVASVFFFLDWAPVVSFLRRYPASAGLAGREPRAAAALAGAAWMAAALSGIVWLAGGLGGASALAPPLGFAAGFALGAGSHRISPVDPEAVQAGVSLGLRSAQILREIVVPGGRPGLLAWLNGFGRRLPAAARPLPGR